MDLFLSQRKIRSASGAEMSERSPAGGRVKRLGFARLAAWIGVCLALASLTCTGSEAAARKHHWRNSHGRSVHVTRSAHLTRWQPTRRVFRLTDPEKDAALILDGETGR